MPIEVRKFRDIEVIVNSDDHIHPINLSKLAESLTGSRQSFRDILRDNVGFWKMVNSYLLTPEAASSLGGFPPNEIDQGEDLKHDLNWLLRRNICSRIQGGSNHRAEGVYGPTILADWIAINCKTELFIQIHQLFELVERRAGLENRTFEEGVNSIIDQQKRQIERLTGERDDLASRLDRALKQMEDQTQRIAHLEENDEINQGLLNEVRNDLARAENQRNEIQNDLTIARAELATTRTEFATAIVETQQVVRETSTQLRNEIRKTFNGKNLTFGKTEEILVLIERQELIDDFERMHLRNENQTVFDTIACQKRDLSSHLCKHNFNRDIDRIVMEFKTSNSIDLTYFFKTRFTETEQPHCSLINHPRYIRKIVLDRDFEDLLITRLTEYAESINDPTIGILRKIESNQTRIENSIVNRVDNLADDVRIIQQQMDRIEQPPAQAQNEHDIGEARVGRYFNDHGWRRLVYEDNGVYFYRYGRGGNQRHILTAVELENDNRYSDTPDRRIHYE